MNRKAEFTADHGAYNRYVKAVFSDLQSEAIAEDIYQIEHNLEIEMKSLFDEMNAKMDAKFAALRAELPTKADVATKAELAALPTKADVSAAVAEASRDRLTRVATWGLGIFLAFFTVLGGGFLALMGGMLLALIGGTAVP